MAGFCGGVSKSSSNLETSADAEAEWTVLEQRLESFLEAFKGNIASLSLLPDQREQALDDIAATGMAAIQSSFKTSEGNVLLYHNFHRLRRTLRHRIASMVP